MAQEELTTLPVGRLGLVPLESCRSLGQKVDEWLVKWRKEREHSESDSFAFEGYKRDSYTIKVQNPRFGSGEGKCVITESVRGDDVYILVDVCNYNISYPIGKYTNLMSPDDHYQDLKRVIAAIGGKARRVEVQGNLRKLPSDGFPEILLQPVHSLHASACVHARTPVRDSG